MHRKPIFWILLTISSFSGVFYFFENFDSAFPALTVNVKMNREMALRDAEILSSKYNWAPEDYKSAITFNGNRSLQTFVELEGGGLDTFKMLYTDSIFFPYVWKVRHFQEKNPNEVSIWFTPKGLPYSFSQKLSENEPGSALSRDEAFEIAIASLKDEWFVDIDQYNLVDESEKVQPGGRVDHTFTYQLSNFQLGENGSIKLRLIMQGDRLGELMHFAQVPEAFKRRFSEMRSANDTIAFSANIIIYLLYGLLGVMVSIFFLMRTRWILWRHAILWGMIVGFFQVAVQLNFIPMMWMEYNTAISETSFMMEIIFSMLILFILQSTLYGLSFVAAESLTRKAFPNQIQFWKIWSPNIANSTTVLGQTLGGYLITGVFMFYAIAFYIFVTKNLDWWSPADTSYDPNLLAAYFPWLTSIGISLGAGFWEECLFRAVPLAGAALIGDRYGKRNLLIGIAFIFQAVVFGAAHANYPVQPAYARVVELMIPSFLFAYIYLRFGLLPGIIMHYSYDVAMISLQLFTADVPGIYFQRLMVVLFLFIPLWVILFFRFKTGKWNTKLGKIRNSNWQVPPPPLENEEPVSEQYIQKKSVFFIRKNLIVVGALGLLFWIFYGHFYVDQQSMKISKTDAIKIADEALINFGFSPDSTWKMESRHNSFERQMDRFVWQEYGKEAYYALRGKYLSSPSWEIRYRKYYGDVADRAEEYKCYVNYNGDRVSVWHQIPESRVGLSLSEKEARSLVLDHIKKVYEIDPLIFLELEANSFKKPNRLDWQFIYEDTTTFDLDKGQLRLTVALAGDHITGSFRSVFVPESWKRSEEEKESRWFPIELILGLSMTLSLAYVVVFGTISWSKKKFDNGLFKKILFLFIGIGLVQLWSGLPMQLFNFKTDQPYSDQLYQAIIMSAFVLFLGSLLKAIIISSSKDMVAYRGNRIHKPVLWDGVFVGLFLVGGYSLIDTFFPTLGPNLGNYSPLNAKVTLWGQLYASVTGYVNIVIGALSVVICLNVITKNWQNKIPIGILYTLLIGFSVISQNRGAFESIILFLFIGCSCSAIFLLLYIDFIRYNPSLIPVIFGTMNIVIAITKGSPNLYTGHLIGACVCSIFIAGFSYLWYRLLEHS